MEPFANIEKNVLRILAHYLHKRIWTLSADKHFFTDLSMDTTDYLLTLVEIENEFHVDIPDEVAFSFYNAEQIIAYLSQRMAA